MNATVELDKLGRFVVPKKIRDALHVQPGDKLKVSILGDVLTIEPVQNTRGLSLHNGRHVIAAGPLTNFDVVAFIQEERKRHMFRILGMPEDE